MGHQIPLTDIRLRCRNRLPRAAACRAPVRKGGNQRRRDSV